MRFSAAQVAILLLAWILAYADAQNKRNFRKPVRRHVMKVQASNRHIRSFPPNPGRVSVPRIRRPYEGAATYQIANLRPADDYSTEENYKQKHEDQDYPDIYENQEETGGSIESAYELLEKTYLKDSHQGAYIAIHKRPPPQKKQSTGDKVAVIIKQVGHRPAVDEYGKKTDERHGYLLVPVMSKLKHPEASDEEGSVQDDHVEPYVEVSKPEVHQELEDSEEYQHQGVPHREYPKVRNYFQSEEEDVENQDHQTSVPVLIPAKDVANIEVDAKGRYVGSKWPIKFKLPLKKPIVLTAHGGAPPIEYIQKKPRKTVIGVSPSSIDKYTPIIIATKKAATPPKRYKKNTPIVLTTQYKHDDRRLSSYGKYKKQSVPVYQSLPLRNRGLWKSQSYRAKSTAAFPSRPQYPQPRIQRKVKPILPSIHGSKVFQADHFKTGDVKLTELESTLGIPKRRWLEKLLYDLNPPVIKYPVIRQATDLGRFF